MKSVGRLSLGSLRRIALVWAVLGTASFSVADTIYTAAATKGGAPFPRKGVTISKIDKTDDGEVLRYTTAGGAADGKKLDEVVQIEAEGETVFNQAEAEFQKGDLAAAGDDYGKAISSTQKDWIKHRSQIRLLLISGKTGNFLAAVRGFVELAKKDPEAAKAHKPAIPANSTELPSAIASVNQGLAGMTRDGKLVVLPFKIELCTKSGDTKGAQGALDELTRMQPTASPNPAIANTGAETAGSDMAERNQAEALIVLTSADKALASHDYAGAMAAINKKSAVFVAPDQQAKALYIIAQCKAATAATPEAWEDAAMAYMRVVAHFKSMPDPAADALYQTGVIEEKLNKPSEARQIYDQVINEYKDTNAAKEAEAAKARLK